MTEHAGLHAAAARPMPQTRWITMSTWPSPAATQEVPILVKNALPGARKRKPAPARSQHTRVEEGERDRLTSPECKPAAAQLQHRRAEKVERQGVVKLERKLVPARRPPRTTEEYLLSQLLRDLRLGYRNVAIRHFLMLRARGGPVPVEVANTCEKLLAECPDSRRTATRLQVEEWLEICGGSASHQIVRAAQ